MLPSVSLCGNTEPFLDGLHLRQPCRPLPPASLFFSDPVHCFDSVQGSQGGSGANSRLDHSRAGLSCPMCGLGYAARAACQISGIVALLPPSLPILNCSFLIFSASSIPLITTAAVRKLFSPNIGRSRCLTRL